MNWLSVARQDPSEIHNPDLLLFWHAPGRLLHPRECHYWGMHVKRGLLTPPRDNANGKRALGTEATESP